MKKTYCVIMAGGIGSRFWPQSTPAKPKQFLDILNEGVTMIQQTVARVQQFCELRNIVVVTSQAYRQLVTEQLPGLTDNQIMGEPCMRNTAPCIAWAVWKISELDPDARIVVVPSDSYIPDTNAFANDCIAGLIQVSNSLEIMTLGIQPTSAETGYGYIEAGTLIDIQNDSVKQSNSGIDGFTSATRDSFPVFFDPGIDEAPTIYNVISFREKPTIEKASEYLTSGNYYWNAGIFMASAQTFKAAFNQYLPGIASQFEKLKKVYNTPEEQKLIDEMFPQCTNISIDYGIMEKAGNVVVMPASFRWSDVGAWNAVHELQRKDEKGNTLYAEGSNRQVVYSDTHNCLVSVPEGTQAVIEGVNDLIIVQSGNRLLVCRKDSEQKIKEFSGRFVPVI